MNDQERELKRMVHRESVSDWIVIIAVWLFVVGALVFHAWGTAP